MYRRIVEMSRLRKFRLKFVVPRERAGCEAMESSDRCVGTCV